MVYNHNIITTNFMYNTLFIIHENYIKMHYIEYKNQSFFIRPIITENHHTSYK